MKKDKDGLLEVEGAEELIKELEGTEKAAPVQENEGGRPASGVDTGKEDVSSEGDAVEVVVPAGQAEEDIETVLRNKLLRVAADFDNYKKRVARERSEIRAKAAEDLIRDLLPVVDNIERAVDHADDRAAGTEALVDGIKLVIKQFMDVLSRHGVEQFGEVGERFDPAIHEALAQREEKGAATGSIVEVYQKGYMVNGHMIRPAMVIVAASTGEQKEDDSDSDEHEVEKGESSQGGIKTQGEDSEQSGT